MEKRYVDIISSEIVVDEKKLQEVDEEISKIDKKLEEFIINLDSLDYSISIGSGIITGLLDSLFVGDLIINNESKVDAYKQVNKMIIKFAKSKGANTDRLKQSIKYLEEKYYVPNDNIWRDIEEGLITPKNHHLADFAHHASPVGLLSFVIVYYFGYVLFVNREGTVFFKKTNDESLKSKQTLLLSAMIITIALNTLLLLSKNQKNYKKLPKSVKNLLQLVANSPILLILAKASHQWLGHLISDMGGSKNTAGKGMGIPGIFISFLHEISGLPVLKDTNLPKIVNDLYVKDKLDFRHEVPIYKGLSKQVIPVVINDILVRLSYLIKEFSVEMKKSKSIKEVNFKKCIPLNSRKLNRMLAIADTTFFSFDITDATVRTLLEVGPTPLALAKIVSRVNYVGGGKFVYSISREIISEKEILNIIKERNRLSEEQTKLYLAQMAKCIEVIESTVDEQMCEDLTTFFEAFSYIDNGLEDNDSNSVILGYKILNAHLGKDIQFDNQDSFDKLMSSKEVFEL